MSLEALGIAFGLLVVTVLWIAAPLLRHRGHPDMNATQRERLLAHYDRALTNVRDLDEDYAIGKLDYANYQKEREQLVQQGIEILIALDATLPKETKRAKGKAGQPTDAEVDESVDEKIERAVAAYRRAMKA